MNKVHSKGGSVHCGAIAVPEDEQKDNRIKNRCDEECLIQELLIQKSGESPAQIAVSAGHKSAGIVSIKVFCIETQSV